MAVLEGAVLPKGSWIFVTGANGYVASHVVDQFLRLGYKVRGTVRDANKSSWVGTYFQGKYGKENFELVEVRDLTDADALKTVLAGCSGFAAVASVVSFSPNPHELITPAVAMTRAALAAARATPGLRRFVQTSSSSAATFGASEAAFDLGADDYNATAVGEAWAPPPYGADRIMAVYAASKVLQEQEVWRFVREEIDPPVGFVANTVLPDFVNGRILSVENQGYPSSISILKALWDGDMAHASVLPPQWEIDAEDTGMLHVAAMLHPDAKGERIFGFAYPKTLKNTIQYLRELYPEKQFLDPPENEGENKANILAKPRAEELLKWVKGSGWTGYKESLKYACDPLLDMQSYKAPASRPFAP